MSLLSAWFFAARPKTLVAAIIPVGVAWALAAKVAAPSTYLMLCALGAAVLLQIATNYWNDYYDDLKGSDREGRLGPRRLLQQKLATRAQVRGAALLFNLLSFLVAVPIFLERGWFLAGLGLLCLLMSIAYTGGPFPLAYLGLGELFVLIFFGWVATYFSYFVGTGEWNSDATLLGLQAGLLSCALITINNLRDEKEDRASRKHTLVVLLGRRMGLLLLALELLAPYVLAIYWRNYPPALLSLAAFPLAIFILRNMYRGKLPNQQLALASLHALIFLGLWAWGIHKL